MSFNTLKVDDLKAVVGFFAKDVTASDPAKPTKKELIAALASDEGQGPVSWEEYENIYLPAKAAQRGQEKQAEPEAEPVKPANKIPSPDDEESDVEYVLVKYTGQNPRWDVIGYTFVQRHPYASIPLEKAEWLIMNQADRFRVALPTEVKDYYN